MGSSTSKAKPSSRTCRSRTSVRWAPVRSRQLVALSASRTPSEGETRAAASASGTKSRTTARTAYTPVETPRET
ncbi:hypothetical protein SLNWT_6127 [Streptomyces albus]|uniref:Uncharacterized protein n=1 Tax=Streptomyces albus (strain ATCC 21838 / DSM 41398 / FERM P-419 / JCM 4703 / NBRC 107858) TaxID=1081613 RepID=A0A0B5EUI1_STRA4|nr:hypothetical protein SLNWT_6127 [Streptomyces albus]AOU80806.1 hypothetical protein SLNHY_6115 [Streptomyces albus]